MQESECSTSWASSTEAQPIPVRQDFDSWVRGRVFKQVRGQIAVSIGGLVCPRMHFRHMMCVCVRVRVRMYLCACVCALEFTSMTPFAPCQLP